MKIRNAGREPLHSFFFGFQVEFKAISPKANAKILLKKGLKELDFCAIIEMVCMFIER